MPLEGFGQLKCGVTPEPATARSAGSLVFKSRRRPDLTAMTIPAGDRAVCSASDLSSQSDAPGRPQETAHARENQSDGRAGVATRPVPAVWGETGTTPRLLGAQAGLDTLDATGTLRLLRAHFCEGAAVEHHRCPAGASRGECL